MLFWVAACLLTIAAMASLAIPLVRAVPAAAGGAFGFDREIYKARIGEIETDLSLGRIGSAEADAAKAEEARKLIALSDGPVSPAGFAAPETRFALFAALLFVPAFAALIYLSSGAPGMPDMAIASRADRTLADQSIEQLLERAEAQLAANPADGRGWKVVAPVYLRLGRVEDAVHAWRTAARLDPGDADLKLSLAEAMTVLAQGVVTQDAKLLFDEVLKLHPADAKARFYLAIALGQQGLFGEAASAWRSLIAEAPPQAPWLEVAKAQLETAETRLGLPQRGPSAEDVEAAKDLPQADRQAMIEQMVAGLAERLAGQPLDKEGWLQLVRSYTVLGRTEEAAAAIGKAQNHFADDAEFMTALKEIAGTGAGASQ